MGAGEFVSPVVGRMLMRPVFDDAGLAGAHAAGHGLFEGDLAGDIEVGGDLGGGFHHGGGAAAIDDGAGERGGLAAVFEECAKGLGDVAFHAEGAVIGGDDGGGAIGHQLEGIKLRLARRIRRRCGGVEGNGEEVFALRAKEGDGLGGSAGEGFGEVKHRGDADAAADEAGHFEVVRDVEADAKGAEEGELLTGVEACEEMGAAADDAVDDVDLGAAVGLNAVVGDGEGAAEIGDR